MTDEEYIIAKKRATSLGFSTIPPQWLAIYHRRAAYDRGRQPRPEDEGPTP
jgi:hypothetical protein